MTKKTLPSRYSDQGKLNELTSIVLANIDDIYNYFNVRSHKGDTVCFSSCFIHGGDNRTAMNLYYKADYRVHFKCRTHGCEECFGSSLLSMIRGGLSHIRHGWTMQGDKTVTFDQTVQFLLARYNLNFDDIKGAVVKTNSNRPAIDNMAVDITKKTLNISREAYRDRVELPSRYYLNRNYSIEVLDKYDVGDCKTYGKPFFNRAIVPIYDDMNQGIVGFTGRSIFERCEKCNSYHNPDKECHFFSKWRHTKGFQKEKSLYNYGKARPYIQESGTIILVESPGNVWRLEEAGIHNSVAIFGTSLSRGQRQLIDESGALTIVLIMDNDDNGAGQEAAEAIKEQCQRAYRVYIIGPDVISKGDVGEMNTNEITTDIKPLINKIIGTYEI